MTDKPLHVQVAEALGWQRCYLKAEFTAFEMYKSDDWRGFPPGRSLVSEGFSLVEIPRYDLDWSATGPLIEKFGITLYCDHRDGKRWTAMWKAYLDLYLEYGSEGLRQGPTPLLAVCNLILELHKADKLTSTV